MDLISLQSGSNGNCVYVEHDGVRLLFDAGISGKRAEERLAQVGRDIRRVDAVVISHDHADHIASAGVLQRKFGLPLYVTPSTLAASIQKRRLGKLTDVHHFEVGDTLDFGALGVETVPTPHDGADGCGFVVTDGSRRLGILTDLGHVFGRLREVIASLDAVLIESNYDPEMLANGPYPWEIQNRIRGAGGHLSNLEAAELLAESASAQLKWVCLGHLSGENNDPELALDVHEHILPHHLGLHLAWRHGVSDVLAL